MHKFKTEQESFWAGEFGTEYTSRNQSSQLLASNIAFFSRVFSAAGLPDSVIEIGANQGLNLRAIRALAPNAKLSAVEINPAAVEQLKLIGGVEIHHQSILEFSPRAASEVALSKGVLIHIDPAHLPQVYDLLHRASRRWICIAEYYNPKPVEVSYRGHSGKLFKRDFAGELLDKFPDLRLADYGFAYHRDPSFPQDDLTWFLLEKKRIS